MNIKCTCILIVGHRDSHYFYTSVHAVACVYTNMYIIQCLKIIMLQNLSLSYILYIKGSCSGVR